MGGSLWYFWGGFVFVFVFFLRSKTKKYGNPLHKQIKPNQNERQLCPNLGENHAAKFTTTKRVAIQLLLTTLPACTGWLLILHCTFSLEKEKKRQYRMYSSLLRNVRFLHSNWFSFNMEI